MQSNWKICLLFLFILSIGVPTFAQTQELPEADWYSVVWVRGDDTLHWISPNGEPAAIPRPKLADELANANPQMRFSRDGRYMLLVAELNSGVNGIGIYDIQAGQFTQTHQAQTGEIIYLGRDHTSNLSATHMAVGFASADFDNPAWRIIIFDLATGAPSAVLSNETASWEMDIPPSIPVVTYYEVDESIGQEDVHFQMIPKLESPEESVPAFKWYPALDAPADMGLSPHTLLDADINYLTGEIVSPYSDANFPSLPAPESGLNYNAIGRTVPTLEDIIPTNIWIDQQRYLYSPVWANSTEWIAFFTEAAEAGIIAGWQIIPRDGILTEKTLTPLPANAREVYGTPDGLLVIDIENRISHITDLSLVEGTLLFQAPDAQLSQIVFVSREADVFSLTGVAAQPIVTAPTPDESETAIPVATVASDDVTTADNPVFCEGTLPSILSIGSTAQIANTDGIPLRVRETPGGSVLTEAAEGTAFTVIDGPECFNGYTWWQIEFTNTGTVGWSAEGDAEDYWVEILVPAQPTATPTLIPTAIPPEATAEPIAESTEEAIDSEATEAVIADDGLAGDGNCDASPETRITVGINVLVQVQGGLLAFRASPLDATPVAQLPDLLELPVVGGPACRAGYRQWQVRATVDGTLRDGWVSEGTLTRYFLEPIE